MDLTEKTANINRHPWELSRAHCILNLIKRYTLRNVADIGAGDLFFASKLKTAVRGDVYAIDTGYGERSKITDGINCLNNISDLHRIEDGAIILMDVLEHIDNDSAFLGAALEKISVDGLVVITVPSFQFLFSGHDKFLKHLRRYNKKRLLALIRSHNLHIERCHYFYTSLFFIRILTLLLKKRQKNSADKESGVGTWRFNEKHIVTRLIYTILNIDFNVCGFFAKFKIFLPGLSLLAVCKKQEK